MTTTASVVALGSTARVAAPRGRVPRHAQASIRARRVRSTAVHALGASTAQRASVSWRDRSRRGRLSSLRPHAVKGDDLPEWLDDKRWNKVVDDTVAAGDEEDGAAMALASDYGDPLEYDRSFAVWICMAVSAVVYSVPFGFVRWNLSSLAPLVWWQLGLSTAVGTLLAMPLIAMITVPAAKHNVNFPIFARASFGVRGALLADAGRGTLGLFLFTLITLAGGEALLSLLSALVNDGIVFDGILANPSTFMGTVERAAAYLLFWGAQVGPGLLRPGQEADVLRARRDGGRRGSGVQDGGGGHRRGCHSGRHRAVRHPARVLGARRPDHRRLVHALGDAPRLRAPRGERDVLHQGAGAVAAPCWRASPRSRARASPPRPPWSACRWWSRRAW
jgi:hypothetical protein